MTVTTQHLTLDEFLARDFPPRTQLVNGEVVMNAPLKRHDRIGFFLARRIADWVDDAGTGEAGVAGAWTAAGDNYFIPDAWWTHPDHRASGEESLTLRYPDLVIEVRSPSTWRYDVGPKREAYERAGVTELWLVDVSSDTVIVNRRAKPSSSSFDLLLELGRGESLTSPLLRGFTITLDEVFDR